MGSEWFNLYDQSGLSSASQSAQSSRAQYAQYAVAQAANALSSGNNDKAIAAFKNAVALDPNNTASYNYLGKIYLSQGKNKDAINAYKQLVRIQSNQATKDTSTNAPTLEAATISLGNAYLQAKQYDLSEQQFKSAAKLQPRDPLPPYTLAQQYLTQGRLGEALTQIQKAQKLAPNDGNIFYALGSIYNAQGNYLDAAQALQTSIQRKPNFPAANYELGVAYNALNYTEGVQQQLKILNSSDANLASQLTQITKPQIVGIDSENRQNTLKNNALGANTPLFVLDPTLIVPNSSQTVSTVIQFSKDMNYESVTNVANWSISRGNTTQSGFYNNSMPISSKDARIPPMPVSVTYDATKREAIVKLRLNQNSSGDAKIDPNHIVFTFNGKDASGQSMDQTANAIDGYANAPFGSIDTLA